MKVQKKILFSLLMFLFSANSLFAQQDSVNSVNKITEDTTIFVAEKNKKGTVVVKKKSPTKAAIISAILPGSGQVYNGKYWKVPIVYSAFSALSYTFITNHRQYIRYLDAYIAEVDDDSTTVSVYNGLISVTELQYNKDKFRRNRDISALLMIGVYFLTIIDATVDAHLSDFDIGDDLSLNISPVFYTIPNNNGMLSAGINFRFKFK